MTQRSGTTSPSHRSTGNGASSRSRPLAPDDLLRDGAADLVIRGGTIHLVDEAASRTDAIAIRAGRVVALGPEVRRSVADQTRVIELEGRTVVPGINDAHLHAAWLGARWPRLFFGGEGDAETDGRLVTTSGERRAALLRAWELLASFGITSYTEPGIGPGEDDGETGCFGTPMLETYLALHREGVQTSRVTLLRLFGALDGESSLADFEEGIAALAPATDPRWLSIPGVKIFAEGIPPLCGAWVREPYADGSSGGLLTTGGASSLDAFRRMVRRAHETGLQVAVHATGDRTIAEFVRVIEELGGSRASAPHYVVHGDLVTPELLTAMREAGVGLALQPSIAALTREWAAGTLGAERAARAWPMPDILDAGVLASITSDAPVADPDWRRSLDSALELLADGGVQDSVSVRQALLRRMTVDPAQQDGAASWKGNLEVGKVADLCVLDNDPLELGRSFLDVHVISTVVAGRVVYQRSGDGSVKADAA